MAEIITISFRKIIINKKKLIINYLIKKVNNNVLSPFVWDLIILARREKIINTSLEKTFQK